MTFRTGGGNFISIINCDNYFDMKSLVERILHKISAITVPDHPDLHIQVSHGLSIGTRIRINELIQETLEQKS